MRRIFAGMEVFYSTAFLAAECGMSPRTIRWRAAQLGLKPREASPRCYVWNDEQRKALVARFKRPQVKKNGKAKR